MKILVRNLLPIIAIFIHLRESNSSGIHEEDSAGPSSSYNNTHLYTAPLIIHYKGRDIEVSFHIKNGHPSPADCKVLGKHRGVPGPLDKVFMNYITRALMYDGIKYCVVYELGNGEVLGAKLPPILDDQPYTGDPRDFNPDASKCYITYICLDFEVLANPVTGKPSNIKLLPHNIVPDQRYISEHFVDTIPVNFCGLYFLLYRRYRLNGKPDFKNVGAALDPRWQERLAADQARFR